MACLATTVKIIGKKLNTFLRSLLRYCKDIANLFGYFGHTWPNPSKKIVSICRKLLMFINMQKIRFITHFFLKILQRFCKPVILDTSAISGHATKIDSTNLQESLIFICMKKTQLHPSLLSGDIAKMLQTY